jgi:hypothetical protein
MSTKKHDTRNGWYYGKYINYVISGTVLPPSRYKNERDLNDRYNEMTELIFRCWYEGVKPSTCNRLIRILNLERIPL